MRGLNDPAEIAGIARLVEADAHDFASRCLGYATDIACEIHNALAALRSDLDGHQERCSQFVADRSTGKARNSESH